MISGDSAKVMEQYEEKFSEQEEWSFKVHSHVMRLGEKEVLSQSLYLGTRNFYKT